MSDTVLTATLDVPFECAFLKAGAMNGLPTYPVPPVTTLQGLLYSALGRPSLLKPNRLDRSVRNAEEAFRERVQQDCEFGLRVVDPGERTENLRMRQKATQSNKEPSYLTYPTQMETIIAPTYRVYVGGPQDLLEDFATKLAQPQRPLYLGRSDDLVVVSNVSTIEATRHNHSTELDCLVPGATADPILLPVSPDYRGRYTEHPGELKTVSVSGGTVDAYWETADEEQFVYVT